MSKPRITIRMPADLHAYVQSKGDNVSKTVIDIIATHKRVEERLKCKVGDLELNPRFTREVIDGEVHYTHHRPLTTVWKSVAALFIIAVALIIANVFANSYS